VFIIRKYIKKNLKIKWNLTFKIIILNNKWINKFKKIILIINFIGLKKKMIYENHLIKKKYSTPKRTKLIIN
jgi:hypothetical protein